MLAIADCGSFSAAAKTLFVSQSTLSAAIKDLEEELDVKLFSRTNRGVSLTVDGEDFVRNARDIVERADHLESRYQHRKYAPKQFAVSTQRLPFSVRAFNRFVEEAGWDVYDVAIRECPTYTIISDVESGKSDIGVLAIHDQFMAALQRVFSSNDVVFEEMSRLPAFAFMRKSHPLSNHESISMEELLEYPFVTYDQEADRSEYTEEIFFHQISDKTIHVCDRCTKVALVRLSNAFSIGTDLTNSNADSFHGNLGEIVRIPIKELTESMHIGILKQKNVEVTTAALKYLELLQESIDELRNI